MEQLLLHLWGDYILQSDWMAQEKTKKWTAAMMHATVYTIPFLFLTSSLTALIVIGLTHCLIDRFRLARFVVYAKNILLGKGVFKDVHENCDYCCPQLNPKFFWHNCKETGYPKETPQWLAVWLLIIADNTLHLTINYFALKYL